VVADTGVTCPACGARAREAFRVGDRNRRLSAAEFTYRRCPDCGLVFLRPVPDDLGEYYRGGYYGGPQTREELAAGSVHERYKLDLLRPFVPYGRLIELGGAMGGFAYQAQQAGYDVTVVEMDPDSCRFLEEVVGVRAVQSSDPAAALDELDGDADAIAAWHVIEHLPDPWSALEASARKLRPGGVLVLAAPDPGSVQARLFGRGWTHLDAPRHLQLIPRELLLKKARAAGLEPVLVTTRDEGGLFWNSFGWQQSLTNRVRGPRAKWLLMWTGRALSLAARPLERGADRGATYTVVFRRT
jgi:SAM-dependent methyltransferase